MRSGCVLALVGLAALARAGEPGRVVVVHDEWPLSNTGFAQAPTTGTFVANLIDDFGGPGDYLGVSTNFGLTQNALASALAATGSTWTVVSTAPTLDELLDHDGVFVGGDPGVDAGVLIDYREAGGNIYVMAGTGNLGGPAGEAATWNPLLATVGLMYATTYNSIGGFMDVDGNPHPLFAGVESLWQDNGNSIIDLDPDDDIGEIVVFAPGGDLGLIAVSEIGGGCVPDCNADGVLNILDFVCFQQEFQAQTGAGDCDGNGVYNVLDFVCFQLAFQAGCG